MTRSTTIINSEDGQTVPLPEDMAFPSDVRQVEVIKLGQGRLIVPKGKRWDDWFRNGPRASEDFFSERE